MVDDRRIHRAKPRPRALLFLEDSEEELAAELAELFIEPREINDPNEIQQKEFDVLITTRGLRYDSHMGAEEFSYHLYVVAFGGRYMGEAKHRTTATMSVERWFDTVRDKEFLKPDPDLPDGVPNLVERDLLPQAEARTSHRGMMFSSWEHPATWQSFLKSSSGAVLAGRFTRPGGTEVWTLPEDVRQHAEWVRVALRHWRSMDPDRFRSIPGWERRPEWLTAEEAEVQHELDELSNELQDFVARAAAKRESLESRMAEVHVRAEQTRRKLLTASGDELVDEVESVLKMLGFDVMNVDSLLAEGEPKKEDLRISDGDWRALVEVKGYPRGGAKTGDLLQLGKFQLRYEREARSKPDATWYVVNQRAGQDPDLRQPVFASDPEALQHFTEVGGVALDTTALFRMVAAVERGDLEKAWARSMLKTASGAFTYPPPS